MLARTREWIPSVAVTSDFIVGFCGETEADFQHSMDLVRESRFKNSFIFKYSERPGTKGADLYADDVPEDVKRRRNNELLALQNEISEEDNHAFLGREVEVLVEGPSKAAEKHVDASLRDAIPPASSRPAPSPQPRAATHRPHPLRPNRRLRRQSAAKSATSCPSSSTTPTPTRSLATSSRGTLAPSSSRFPLRNPRRPNRPKRNADTFAVASYNKCSSRRSS